MRKLILLFIGLCITMMMQASVSKTVDVATASTLSTCLTSTELSTVTDLTITGTIDARDFLTMRESMPLLANLDLSNVNIVSYTGSYGTGTSSQTYQANVIPNAAFINKWSGTPVSKISLKSVVLPNSLIGVMTDAFNGCTGLVSVHLGDLVTYIYNTAFKGCTALTTINIPISVISIGNGTFQGCTALKPIELISPDAYIGSSTFKACTSLTEITVNCTSLGQEDFSGCTGLKTVHLLPTLTFMGSQVFYACTGLTDIYSYLSSPIILQAQVFGLVNVSACVLHVPFGSKALYQAALQWKDFLNIVEDLPVVDPLHKIKNLSLYPSPATNEITIKSEQEINQVRIYDMQGQLVLASKESTINVSNFYAGMYIAKIVIAGQEVVKKFVKK